MSDASTLPRKKRKTRKAPTLPAAGDPRSHYEPYAFGDVVVLDYYDTPDQEEIARYRGLCHGLRVLGISHRSAAAQAAYTRERDEKSTAQAKMREVRDSLLDQGWETLSVTHHDGVFQSPDDDSRMIKMVLLVNR